MSVARPHDRTRILQRPRQSGSVLLLLVFILVLVACAGGLAWFYFQSQGEAQTASVLVRPVMRGPYEHVVLEQGQVESASSVEIRCEVKSQATSGVKVLWVIEEGSHVKVGDKLVQLDASAFEQNLIQQQIVCNTSQATVIQAENTLRAAEIARIEYLEGTFRQEEQTILSEAFVAEENLRRAQLAFQSTERLAAKGIVTSLQLEGDQFAVEKAKNELEAAKTKLEVLRNYTKAKMLKQFDSDIATAAAKWEAEKESYKLEMTKLEDIKQQIANCTIVFPQPEKEGVPLEGQVVYANLYSHRGGSAEFVLEAGATVRENQVLIRLPDSARMQIKATINESRISLIRAGMPVAISVDAVKDRVLSGTVTKVNPYAEPGSWSSGNIREYAAFIDIHDPPPEIRTGMNAEVRIFVDRQENALQVPVQALCETKGHFFCLVQDGTQFETREVRVRSSNDSFMIIESGLEEGQQVVMNPRGYPDKLQLPDLPDAKPVLVAKAGLGSDAPAVQPVAARAPAASNGAAPAPAGAAAGAEKPGGGGDPSQLFALVDKDGDGSLTAAELDGAPADRRDGLLAADANGDGVVSRDEFLQAASKFLGGGKPVPTVAGGAS